MSKASNHSLSGDTPEIAAFREFQRLIGNQVKDARTSAGAAVVDLEYPGAFHLLQALPAALYTTDATGRITFYNEAAAALWGHRPKLGTDEWCGSWRLYWPDGTFLPHDECPIAMALKVGRAIHGIEAVAERPDGTRIPFLAFPTPFFGSSGEVIGAVNMLVDISGRKATELAAQRLAAIVESSDDAIVSKDLDGIVTSWNQGAERLFGYSEREVIGKSITILIPPDRQDEEPMILARIRSGERIEHYETVRQKKDGSLLDISLSMSPIVDRNGRIVGASKIARDITEKRHAERQKDLLLAEMRHRIKNSIALAASIGRQTFQSASEEECAVFVSRLRALGNAHDAVTEQSWEGARLRDVVSRTMEPHDTDLGQILVAGPDVAIESRKAVAIAIALHELATNAQKYGALSQSAGTVHIEWAWLEDEPDIVSLRWRERGGPAVEQPKRKGFGTRLIERGLAAEFDAVALEFQPEGVVCTFKVSQMATASDSTSVGLNKT